MDIQLRNDAAREWDALLRVPFVDVLVHDNVYVGYNDGTCIILRARTETLVEV